MVRLLRELVRVIAVARLVVSIPQWCDCCAYPVHDVADCDVRFNPTMVRLLLFRGVTATAMVASFQSHNGAIAAERLCLIYLPRLRFNPTMVRLLLSISLRSFPDSVVFQSHNGAIAARTIGIRASIQILFQSHNGAIAAC